MFTRHYGIEPYGFSTAQRFQQLPMFFRLGRTLPGSGIGDVITQRTQTLLQTHSDA